MSLRKVAIIGTGMTALSIGYHLPQVCPSVQITYFDKSKKVGGRLATRRSRQNDDFIFDHGAAYLSHDQIKGGLMNLLKDTNSLNQAQLRFQRVTSLDQSPSIPARSKQVYVGKNGLDLIPDIIFKQIKNVKKAYFDHRVTQIIESKQNTFSLKFQQNPKIVQNEIGPFDQVFCCIPLVQARVLKQSKYYFEQYENFKNMYNANWIIMLTVQKGSLFARYGDSDVIDFSGCLNSPLKYAVKQNKKFSILQDKKQQNWTLYFSEQWTQKNIELTKQQVQNLFQNQLIALYGTPSINPSFISVHRWLYSSPKTNEIKRPLITQDQKLVFAGDWVGSRQNVGQCWQLGRDVIQELYGDNKDGVLTQNKSKL